MTEEEIQDTLALEAFDAADFIDGQLSNIRITADKYYQGETKLQAPAGRSSIIITKVRDTVKSVIPNVARMFTQSDLVAEFSSENEEDDKITKDQTVFVNSIYNKFGGYKALIEGSTDALKARIGVVKVSLEERVVSAPMPPKFVTAEELQSLVQAHKDNSMQPKVTEQSEAIPQPDGSVLYQVILTHYSIRNIWHLDCVPPESFLVNSSATSADDARLIGTRQNLRVYEAVAMGLPYDKLLEIGIGSVDDTSQMQTEKQQRQTYYTNMPESGENNPLDKTAGLMLIGEFWMQIDANGDGVAELRHFITAGSNYKIVVDEPASFCPLAIFKVDLQPHVMFPISLAEDIMQDQDSSTALVRSILDNTALVNSPRTEVNESQVNLEDAKNNEIGAIVRVKQMGQIQELSTPFVAGQTLPVLQYLDDVTEKRSGVSKMSQGIDSNALQSTSRVAANAIVQGSDARLEMMARNLGETGISSMFLAILRTAMTRLKGHQSVKTGNDYTEVQPDTWHDQVNVVVNVGLGNGRIDEKMAVLQGIIGPQQAFVDKLGFANPICGWENLRNTYKQLLRLGGIKTITDYFPPVTPDILQKLDQQMQQAQQQAAQSQQPPVPDVKGAAQIKAQADMQINQAKLQQEFALRSKENEQQGQIDVAKLKVQQQGEQQRLTVQARSDMQRALMEDDRLRDKQEQDYAVAAQKVAMDDATKRAVAAEVHKTRTAATETVQ
jgi:hypothetical protein